MKKEEKGIAGIVWKKHCKGGGNETKIKVSAFAEAPTTKRLQEDCITRVI